MKEIMPSRKTRKWWKLWYSGAIPKDIVFFDELSSLLLKRQKEDEWYYSGIDPEKVRKGKEIGTVCRGFLDLCAVVAQDLRLTHTECEEYTRRLFGGLTAREMDKKWRNLNKRTNQNGNARSGS
jgi:hypothetical protein